eukprot:2387469-Pleurochrysis_carterae.AAC.1
MTTSRGCSLHGTNGKWRAGADTHSSAMSASTALRAAAACATRPGWWNARTVVSSHAARASTPPSPACSTMSTSCQFSSAATARSSPLSSCRAPGKR